MPGYGPYSRRISACRALVLRVLAMTQNYPTGSAPGSNKVVANPPRAGASQRRDRPRPTARTAAASSSWRSARWTVRWLEPSAYARAKVDHGTAPDGDEHEAAPGRLDPGERAQGGAQAAELDAEPGAMRLVGGARLEGALDEAIARHVGRPGLGERAGRRRRRGRRTRTGPRPRRGGPGGPHRRGSGAPRAPTGHAGPGRSRRPGPGCRRRGRRRGRGRARLLRPRPGRGGARARRG